MKKIALNLNKIKGGIKNIGESFKVIKEVYGPENMKRVINEIKQGYEAYSGKGNPYNDFVKLVLNPTPEGIKTLNEIKIDPEISDAFYAGMFANLAGLAGKALAVGAASSAAGKAVDVISDRVKKNKQKEVTIIPVTITEDEFQKNEEFTDAFSKSSFDEQIDFFVKCGQSLSANELGAYAECGKDLVQFVKEDEGYLTEREAAGLGLIACLMQDERTEKLAEEALEELVDMEKGAQLEILGNIANMNFPDEMLEMIDKGEMHEEIIAELEIFSNAIDAFEKIAADSPVKELDFLQKCIDSFKT